MDKEPRNVVVDNVLKRLKMLVEDTGVLTPDDFSAITAAIAGEGRLVLSQCENCKHLHVTFDGLRGCFHPGITASDNYFVAVGPGCSKWQDQGGE